MTKTKKPTVYVPPHALPMLEQIVDELKHAEARLGKGNGRRHLARLRRSLVEDLLYFGMARTARTAEKWIKAVYDGNYRTTTSLPQVATPPPSKSVSDLMAEELLELYETLLSTVEAHRQQCSTALPDATDAAGAESSVGPTTSVSPSTQGQVE